ncbi:MAG TPA: RNA methyltransferase [Melioribacteraceae bacterium]|nr:RNA methyltransferase [Melioribacteraceae bacterium]
MRKLTHLEITEKRVTLETLNSAKKMPVYVMLDSIRSGYNVGSIFRTSDAAMISKLLLCGYTPTPPNKEVLKTSLGATESIDWEYVTDPVEKIRHLKDLGFTIAALEISENSIPYYSIEPDFFPICLIVGNEITGVKQELLDLCDYSFEIPQYGIKHSLNAAVAYGISIFELRKIFNSADNLNL